MPDTRKNMRLNREQLLNDLEMVKGGVSPREFIEQSSSFCFRDGLLMTFNDEVACKKETCLKGITGAVQASSLTAILSKLPDEDLDVEENDKGELEFRGKRKRFAVTKDAEIFLPIDRVEVPEKWRSLPPEFTEAVGLVKHCVSTNENHFILTCVHLHPEYIEACNNLQLLRVSINTGLKEPVLVRGTSLEHLVHLGMDKIALTSAWIHFKNQTGLIYSCRRYMEEYPPLEALLKVEGHKIIVPKGLAESTDRAAVFAEDKEGDPLVKVSLKDGMIRIRGEGLTGWYKEVRKTTYKGPPMAFVIAPELLKHISEKYSDARISKDKLKVEGGTWQYVTVLGRPDAKETDKNGEE